MRESTLGGLLVLVAAAGFGTLAIFGKLAESEGLSRPTLLLFRFLIGAAVVWGGLLIRDDSVSIEGRPLGAAAVLGVVYAGLTLAYFWGLSFMTASLAGIVFYTYPIYVFVLSAAFLDESLTAPVLGALGLALAGVVLVVGVESGTVELLGIVLVASAAVGYAVYNVAGRVLTAETRPRVLTAYVLLAATAVLALRWLQAGRGLPRTFTHWWIVLGIGVLGTGIPLLFLYEGLGRLEATRVSIISTAEPVVTVLLGVTILDETLAASTVVGGVLVLLGVMLVQVSREQREWVLSKVGLR
jgi:drug/metabolite transporter (DMT)-like permease